MNDRHDLIDESVLRRALRFESDEPLPRFDPAAIAAIARTAGPSRRAILAGLILAMATGIAAGAIWSTLIDSAPAIAIALADAALDAIIAAATFLVPIAQIAEQPAVPMSLLAALAVVIVHELRERKEHVHAHAS